MTCNRLTDGHGILIEFFDSPEDDTPAAVQFWELEVTPPSLMGGGAIDTTTHRNGTTRTKAPKRLVEMGDLVAKVSYHPGIIESIQSIIRQNKWVRLTWPDEDQWGFWGFLDEIKFSPLQVGEQPEAEITVICSMQDNDCEEAELVYTEAT